MNPLQREALVVTEELGDVVFVGAVAVLSYLGWRHRATRDLDLAMASKLNREELEQLGYRMYPERGKEVLRSPRGFKIDIFYNDVSGIPVRVIYKTARKIQVGKTRIKAASLEVLLLAKWRASRPSRPQDREDFITLCEKRGKDVNWKALKDICSALEFSEIERVVMALRQ